MRQRAAVQVEGQACAGFDGNKCRGCIGRNGASVQIERQALSVGDRKRRRDFRKLDEQDDGIIGLRRVDRVGQGRIVRGPDRRDVGRRGEPRRIGRVAGGGGDLRRPAGEVVGVLRVRGPGRRPAAIARRLAVGIFFGRGTAVDVPGNDDHRPLADGDACGRGGFIVRIFRVADVVGARRQIGDPGPHAGDVGSVLACAVLHLGRNAGNGAVALAPVGLVAAGQARGRVPGRPGNGHADAGRFDVVEVIVADDLIKYGIAARDRSGRDGRAVVRAVQAVLQLTAGGAARAHKALGLAAVNQAGDGGRSRYDGVGLVDDKGPAHCADVVPRAADGHGILPGVGVPARDAHGVIRTLRQRRVPVDDGHGRRQGGAGIGRARLDRDRDALGGDQSAHGAGRGAPVLCVDAGVAGREAVGGYGMAEPAAGDGERAGAPTYGCGIERSRPADHSTAGDSDSAHSIDSVTVTFDRTAFHRQGTAGKNEYSAGTRTV